MNDEFSIFADIMKREPQIQKIAGAIFTARGNGLTWTDITIAAVAAMDGTRRLPLHQAFADFVLAADGHWEAVHLAIWWARKLERLREETKRVTPF